MKSTQRRSSIFFDLLLFAGLVVIWIAFAPAKVGGRASYIMVNGISMEPNYHTGDLVIVRTSETYQVGDVVAYRDAEMGQYVIHRIIGIQQRYFVIKGDNNSWIDAYRPTRDEIVGKQWIHAPKAGRLMIWLRAPVNMSLTIVLLGGILMSSMFTKPSQNQKGKKRSALRSSSTLEGAFYVLGFFAIGFLGLAIFAFTRPTTRAADNITYQQDGNYFYSAAGTLGVYDTDMVRTGEPVFPKLTCFLNVGFIYNVLGNQLQNISGSNQMIARIMDAQSGWQRTIPMSASSTFSGNSFFSMTTLDLCQMESMVTLVETETGLRAGTYTIEIVTNVLISANASGQVVTDSFDPVLTFRFDKAHLYLADGSAEVDPMHIMKQGLVSSSNYEANTLPILGWEPTISFLRVFALVGLGLALGGLGAMGWSVFNMARQSEDTLIRLRYGPLLMDVYERSLDGTLPVIDVTSIDDLAKLADRQNAMILHMTLNFMHAYMVQCNGAVYRYVLGSGKRGVAEQDAGSHEILGFIARGGEYRQESQRPIQREAVADVIDMEQAAPANAAPVETQVLRRIKI
ncbi:MAG: signal peptidase I [Chloroflexi bacterium]|nr:signal peptidase I [Chloroflexota bacterium]